MGVGDFPDIGDKNHRQSCGEEERCLVMSLPRSSGHPLWR